MNRYSQHPTEARSLPRRTCLLPWAIAQKAGIEALSTYSKGEEDRLKCNPFSGSIVPSCE
ncbi:hypothetical protein QT982_12675 [Microcoleus sp. herbarium2]